MTDSFSQVRSRAYRRMLVGALAGFISFAGVTAFLLWRRGWFGSMPMFTAPPFMVVLLIGALGLVIGASVSLFGHERNR